MHIDEFEIIATDGLILAGKSWLPENPAIGAVCLIHGLGEHIGRWEHVADTFTAAQIAFFGMDLRGHGKSKGKRGHAPSMNQLLDDIEELIKLARREYNDQPIILYGHSMGGNLVANFVQNRRTSELRAAILTSPWLKLSSEPSTWILRLAKIMNRFCPGFTRNNGLDPSGLSNDPEVERTYRLDPMVHTRISARLFMVNWEGAQNALSRKVPANLPMLVMHGKEDTITSPHGSELFYANNSAAVRIRLWDHSMHELHNETEKIRQQVIQEILEWCLDQFEVKASPPTP